MGEGGDITQEGAWEMETNEEHRSDMIILNYGRDHEPGKSTFSYDAACPAVPQVTEPPPDKDRTHFIAPVILIAIFTIIASFLYYNKRKKKSHNGPTVQAEPLELIPNGNSTNNLREAQ
ncbi:hypothetical protein GDO81_014665 [Engystomops pustulosus]|uniref:Uncharacterized protein n=1 Tax=Engystomops pustulosus TaxID=76066 RepID=A0AAV7BBX8_ENGPU|nr:hypothetical protein GDO81_014665 [Engystomops pustulosus]